LERCSLLGGLGRVPLRIEIRHDIRKPLSKIQTAVLPAILYRRRPNPEPSPRSLRLKKSDRRILKDRRGHPTQGLSRFILRGQRSTFRRKEDQGTGGYVDRYGSGLLFLLVLILCLNVLDAILTMIILENGGSEANPVVRSAIQLFGDRFWVWKFLTVSIPLILLCLHSKFRLVMPLLLGISVIYIVVILFQVSLIVH